MIFKSMFAIVSLFFGLMFVWAILAQAYNLSMLILIAWLICIPSKILILKYRVILLLTWIISVAYTYPYVIGEINNHVKHLSHKLYNQSISHFTTQEKLSIYGLNILMGLAALPWYPQVSKETLYLIVPPPKNGIRLFVSDFPLGSKEIQKAIQPFLASLTSSNESQVRLDDLKLVWKADNYIFGHNEAKYALALNPATLSANATKNGDKWDIVLSTRISIHYPKRSYVTLVRDPELNIEEGLFWVLQELNWLHPYTVVWLSKFSHSEIDK